MGTPGRLDATNSLPDPELKLSSVSLVGQYALQIGFESGHATGIYTYKRLRDLVR